MNIIKQDKNSNYDIFIKNIINNNKSKIFNFFNSDEIELTFTIYIYDSIESLVKGLRERGFTKDPDYMCACFKEEDMSLNFFEPKDNPNNNDWSKEEYQNVIFHELIHGIQYTLFKSTPEWINEGIANYLDGTYIKGIKWLLENYINNNEIPYQHEIENEFGRHQYDSYDYAYLMVHYIIEVNGKDYLIKLLKDKDKLTIETQDLLNRAIEFYNQKYFVRHIK